MSNLLQELMYKAKGLLSGEYVPVLVDNKNKEGLFYKPSKKLVLKNINEIAGIAGDDITIPGTLTAKELVNSDVGNFGDVIIENNSIDTYADEYTGAETPLEIKPVLKPIQGLQFGESGVENQRKSIVLVGNIDCSNLYPELLFVKNEVYSKPVYVPGLNETRSLSTKEVEAHLNYNPETLYLFILIPASQLKNGDDFYVNLDYVGKGATSVGYYSSYFRVSNNGSNIFSPANQTLNSGVNNITQNSTTVNVPGIGECFGYRLRVSQGIIRLNVLASFDYK